MTRAKTGSKPVDAYIAAQPKTAQSALKSVRSAIRKAVPAAEEGISYQIPTYKLHGGRVLFIAAWKQYYSLYPATGRVLAAFKKELAAYEVQKSTIHFPFSQPVPVKLIERIAKFRATEEREKAKAAAPKKS